LKIHKKRRRLKQSKRHAQLAHIYIDCGYLDTELLYPPAVLGISPAKISGNILFLRPNVFIVDPCREKGKIPPFLSMLIKLKICHTKNKTQIFNSKHDID
jgi:hypothetical protein